MSTRNFVPRADEEGGIGTSAKHWATVYTGILSAKTQLFIGSLGPGSSTANLVISNGTTGDAIALAEIQGSRTTAAAAFAMLDFYHQTNRVARIRVVRESADDDGAIEFNTKASGGSLTGRLYISAAGNVGLNTSSPLTVLDANGTSLRLRGTKTPASAGATGNVGEICWDSGYLYVCIATNTWKRAALSTW